MDHEIHVTGYRRGDGLEVELIHVGDDPRVARRVAEMHRHDYDIVEITWGKSGLDETAPRTRSLTG